jgi:DNA polymerase (family 10)
MIKRIILKRGRIISTREGKFVISLSKKIKKKLEKYSKRIEVAGSIRRGVKTPVDIDIVIIPRDKDKILFVLSKLGKPLQGGEKKVSFLIKGVKVEIYFADNSSWGAMLFSYTGPRGLEIGFRKIAKEKGMLLNQYGVFTRDRKYLGGKTEKSVYRLIGKKYKEPEMRE